RLYGSPATTPFPKDGINDHIVSGAATVSPDGRGTKCAFWYRLAVPGHGSAHLRIRLRLVQEDSEIAGGSAASGSRTSPGSTASPRASTDALGPEYAALIEQRRAEADEFYAELTPSMASADESAVMRQA